MTLEEIRAEMLRRGCSKAQAESKTVLVVCDILSETNGGESIPCLMHEIDSLQAKKSRISSEVNAEKLELYRINEEIRKCKEYKDDVNKIEEEISRRALLAVNNLIGRCNDYIDDFFLALNNCETKEGRDTLRKAQMFVNSVDIETPQNNTYFILGLAQILSGECGFAMNELKKISEKKFDKVDENGKSGSKLKINSYGTVVDGKIHRSLGVL